MAQLKRKREYSDVQSLEETPIQKPSFQSTSVKRLNSQVPIYSRHQSQPYRRIKKIGHGKHAICYEVIHPNGNTCAMKTLPINDSGFKDNTMSKIFNEIQIQKLLSKHNSIASFIEEFQFESEYVAIIMEYYPNGSLETHFNNGIQLREWEVRKLMTQLLGGVQFIHQHDIVHGDLKLGNLLLDDHFNLKICDFGHSFNNHNNELYTRNFINTTTFISASNKVIGTPNYLAPEIIQRILRNDTQENLISFQVDIWSIGVIFYLLIVGKFPFIDKTLDLMCERILSCSVEYPTHNRNNFEISKDAIDLITNILKKHPLERLSITEIIAHKWFQSYFPESFNIFDTLNFESYENSTMNMQSLINFKRCLVQSGFGNLLKDKDEAPSDITSSLVRQITTLEERNSLGRDENLTESFLNSNRSVEIRKIRNFLINLEKHAAEEKSKRLEYIKQVQPPEIQYSSHIENSTAKGILLSHYQSTLEKIIECEQQLMLSQQLCPSAPDLTAEHSFTYIANKYFESNEASNTFVYQLSNGDLGMLFPDGHTLLRLNGASGVWYIVPDEQYGWISKCFDSNNLPPELQERVQFVEQAANMMSSTMNGMNMVGLLPKEADAEDVFVRNITFYESNQISMMELSDGTIQFEFKDSEFALPLILSVRDFGESVTLISKIEGIKTMNMLDFLQRYDDNNTSSSEMRNKITIMKKCLKEKLQM
ncbi:hypothetical protein DAKH74_010580 [Maudiozyma humilis]|uniref:Serine/threonine-protein kinase n=1 Tax=Maudiozyma humilis TaxID=51915 RepID=A0AAV5RUR8_MAUHU|nr:hypothetical protein DAKH74_010580 [Kazachstania humilis]